MKQPPKDLAGFIIYFLKPYKLLVTALIIIAFLVGILTVANTYMVKLIVDALSRPDLNASDIVQILLYPSLGYIAFVAFELLNHRASDFVHLKLLSRVRKDILNYSFLRITKQSYSYFQKFFAGNTANNLSTLGSTTSTILQQCDQTFSTIVKLVAASIMLSVLDIYYTIILLVWCLITFLIVKLFSKKSISLAAEYSKSNTALFEVIVDCFANMASVFMFTNKAYERRYNRKRVENSVNKSKEMRTNLMYMRFWQDVAYVVMILICIMLSVEFYRLSQITAGDFVLVISLTSNVAQNVSVVANKMTVFMEEIGKYKQSIGAVTEPITVRDKPTATEFKFKKGQIDFKNVAVWDGGKLTFEMNKLTIDQGEKVAFVGFSGVGKHSLFGLLMRFYDPNKGSIHIDGKDIADIKISSLRKQISLIPQDINLFHRTIEENIIYGDVTASKRKLLNACKLAHCDGFINELTEKYNTLVGERGAQLSVGQRQRIAIARAFLEDAPIIVKEESSVVVDAVSEKKIKASLKKLEKGKTTIILAHKLETLADMDRIVVFDNGCIVQDGTHYNLVREKGLYRNLWKKQAGGSIPTEKN